MNAAEGMRGGRTRKWGLVGAITAAVGASVCCLGPLLLMALGIGGAWVGSLTAMERYRPYWMAATLVFLGMAFFRVYRRPKEVACATGNACSSDGGRRSNIILWVVTALVLGLLALPYLISYAYAGGPTSAAARQVTLSPPRAVVSHDPARVRAERLVEATAKAGFPSTIPEEGGKR